jgi:outer membrane lipoprotein-sorting protein
MKIKTFILIAALWANIAISDNSKTNQFFEFFNSVESLKANFSQTVYDMGKLWRILNRIGFVN